MDKPERLLEQLKSERAELYERQREMQNSIDAYYRRARREAKENVKYVYLQKIDDNDEQISWIKRRITHPTALPMICDLAQVKAERVPSLFEAIFGEKYFGNPSTEVLMSLREKCIEVMRTLRRREQAVLVTCFALDGGPPMTLREVGDKYGLSGNRIAQMRDKALRKMRHPSRSRMLKDYLN